MIKHQKRLLHKAHLEPYAAAIIIVYRHAMTD